MIEAQTSFNTTPLNMEKRVRTLAEVEEAAVRIAIETHYQNLSQAAAALGIARATLYRKIRKYGIKISTWGRKK